LKFALWLKLVGEGLKLVGLRLGALSLPWCLRFSRVWGEAKRSASISASGLDSRSHGERVEG
jgi:hypothetical protein